MAKGMWLLFLACLVGTLAEYVDYDDETLDEEMVRALQEEVAEAKDELATVEAMTTGESARALKDKFKSLKEKIKESCKCENHKTCACCMSKDFKIPIIGSYSLGVCSTIAIDPPNKALNFKLELGPLKLLDKTVSYHKAEEVCKKIEKFKQLEFCLKTSVKESDEKGLSACLIFQANIMDIFNKPLYLPCVNFKNQKLTVDDDVEMVDEGIKVNLKAMWTKFKGLFSKKPK
uniref:Venom protein family 2 protein 1 n=2 Tax=Panheteroptera TaxID=33351 RepID=A0A2K8JLM1_9HEMI|nr:venom protein family 2 protein 1 [Lethocerus distinctifemur]